MSNTRKRRIDPSDRACVECKRRKTRCILSDDGETCTYCIKANKSCTYDEPSARTPLTRKNLDAAEARCKRLEAALKNLQTGSDSAVQPSSDHDTSPSRPQTSWNDATADAPAEEVDVEKVFSEPAEEDFEWQETSAPNPQQQFLNGVIGQDGMASLFTAKVNTGYLGDTSGSHLYESVSSLLPKDSGTHPQEQIRFLPNMQHDLVANHQLASSYIQEHLMIAYFTAYNPCYPVVHERGFREQHTRRSQLPPSDPWHIVYYLVLAIGEWICGYCQDDQSIYYEAARSRIAIDLLESGNVTVVQAFLLLGNYLQKRDRPNTGYNYIGIAYRIALGLGLHREIISASNQPTFALQRRRLLFWTLYCFESGFSITTGRPTLVSDSFIDVRKPQNIDDTQINTSAKLLREVAYPTVCTAIIAQARLAIIANKVHTDFLSVRSCQNVDHQIAVLEQAISNWRLALPGFFFGADVPQWFLGPRQVVLWKEANLRILLLLAAQRHHTDEHDKFAAGKRCHAVALGTIIAIVDFCDQSRELIHMGLNWYAVYFLLQAILALSIHHLQGKSTSAANPQLLDPVADHADCDAALVGAYECLKRLGRSNKAAVRILQIIDRLRGNMQQQNPVSLQEQMAAPRRSVEIPMSGITPNSGISQDGSVRNPIATNFVNDDWVNSADPSLHLFLDNAQSIDEVFEGLQGFPSMVDQDNFAYMTSSMQTMRGFFSS